MSRPPLQLFLAIGLVLLALVAGTIVSYASTGRGLWWPGWIVVALGGALTALYAWIGGWRQGSLGDGGIEIRHMRGPCRERLPQPPRRASVYAAGPQRRRSSAAADANIRRWMQRLHHVFDVALRLYPRCGAAMRVLAVITDPGGDRRRS